METVYLLAGVSGAFLLTGYVLNPPRLMSGIKAGKGYKTSEANGGKIKSFRENVGLIANLIGIIAGILAIIQFFAGKS